MDTPHQFPDIGADPLKTPGDAYRTVNTVEAAKHRLTTICNVAQPGVPDQTALVWRADLSKLINDHTWRSCHFEAMRRAHAESARLRELLEQMLNAAENADETGYVTDVGFVDLDELYAKVRAELTPAGTVRVVIKAQEQAKPSTLKID